MRESLTDGLAQQVAVMNALGDDGELEVAKTDVPGQFRYLPTGSGGVPRQQLIDGAEAILDT
jgi:hypothetical protein